MNLNVKAKKINKLLFPAVITAFIFYIIKHPESSADIVIRGLNLCYLVIIPVIFPFLAFSKIFINSSFFWLAGKFLNKPARFLFGVSGKYANAFFIGGILGFPIGAQTVREVYLANKSAASKNEAERTLAFCNNCSVSFAISAAGIAIFGSFRIGLYLFCIQLISAVFTGIIIRFVYGEKTVERAEYRTEPANNQQKRPDINFSEIISESVNGILNICGTVLFFFIVTNVLFEYLNSAPLISDFLNPEKSGVLPGFVKTVISGIFEISSGIYSLVNINIPMYYKAIFASIILSWSGISVHSQIANILKNTDLSLKPYFTGKIIHVIISALITTFVFGNNYILFV